MIDRIMNPKKLIETLRSFYLRRDLDIKERISDTWGESWIGFMRAYGRDIGLVTKIIGIFPKSEPRVKGIIVAIDTVTGDVKLIADAYSVTGWRTAGASALAYKILSEGNTHIDHLGVIGSGTQARYHLRVFTDVFEIDEIMIYSKNRSKASRIALDYNAKVVELKHLLEKSSVVIAATNSREPVVFGDLLKRGSIVLSVGAPKPVRELDDRVRLRSGCALVDNKEGCLHETDDVRNLELVEIGEALSNPDICSFKEIKLYKSVGTSLLDYAATYYILEEFKKSI